MGKSKGLSIDMRVGEDIVFIIPRGGVDSARITLTLDSKDGRKGRLRIDADHDVRIVRPEKRTVPQT